MPRETVKYKTTEEHMHNKQAILSSADKHTVNKKVHKTIPHGSM